MNNLFSEGLIIPTTTKNESHTAVALIPTDVFVADARECVNYGQMPIYLFYAIALLTNFPE